VITAFNDRPTPQVDWRVELTSATESSRPCRFLVIGREQRANVVGKAVEIGLKESLA